MREPLIKMAPTVCQVRAALKQGTPIFFFDLETTGLSREDDRILSFSAIKYVQGEDEKLEEVERMDHFINPGIHIPEAVTAINHITDERVADCDDEETSAYKIRAFWGEHPLVAGYNSQRFDEGFMNAMYQRVFGECFSPSLHLDVYRMAKEKLDIPSHKLSEVCKTLGTDEGLEFHNSIDDVIATVRSCILLLKRYEKEYIPKTLRRLSVKQASYWGRSHTLQRIYVKTIPYTQTYFDVYKQEWRTNMEDADMPALIRSVCDMYHVTDEKELVKALTRQQTTA